MKLTKLRGGGTGSCPDGRTCPAVHQSERGTLLVIGTVVTDPEALAQMAIGPGEVAIEVPLSLLPEVAQ